MGGALSDLELGFDLHDPVTRMNTSRNRRIPIPREMLRKTEEFTYVRDHMGSIVARKGCLLLRDIPPELEQEIHREGMEKLFAEEVETPSPQLGRMGRDWRGKYVAALGLKEEILSRKAQLMHENEKEGAEESGSGDSGDGGDSPSSTDSDGVAEGGPRERKSSGKEALIKFDPDSKQRRSTVESRGPGRKSVQWGHPLEAGHCYPEDHQLSPLSYKPIEAVFGGAERGPMPAPITSGIVPTVPPEPTTEKYEPQESIEMPPSPHVTTNAIDASTAGADDGCAILRSPNGDCSTLGGAETLGALTPPSGNGFSTQS